MRNATQISLWHHFNTFLPPYIIYIVVIILIHFDFILKILDMSLLLFNCFLEYCFIFVFKS